ncbi:MAG: phosphomethylpyrimidine synthase ThiC [Methanosarcinales archaeon Met12]|nr:MAG: phosphomethylpyrimidine synthase ThiC [Methanosarcinales archaeon Met12]
MMTQIESATQGRITEEMKRVALAEGIDEEVVRERVANGEIVIMRSVGIGKGLRTKINANIGTSSVAVDPALEVEKAKVAVKCGADTVSDLSMGGDIDGIRREILQAVSVPITTVPIYQAVVRCSFQKMAQKDIIETIRKQVMDGVSSIVIHAGFVLETLPLLKERTMGMVSKGGAFTAAWMLEHNSENPFQEGFDDILDIVHDNDVVLSLGNAMRSGCVHDMQDGPQLQEIKANTELADRANDAGIQVIIEGMGGHIWARDIEKYVKYHKEVTRNRPLFVAGPLPIDVAVGYDHIAACVGASLASGAGADYLCAVTPSEHLALPDLEHVREGVIAFRIAAHIGDTIKYGLSDRDLKLAMMRRGRNWEGQFKFALDEERAREIHSQEGCTMCGEYCALEIMDKYLGS